MSHTVVGPEALGLDPSKLDDLLQRARRDVDGGPLPSCQLAVARDGQLAAFATFGEATNDTRYVPFSCTKAIVAGAVWLLIGEDALDPSAKVVDLVPEFGTNGKDVVTVEQVMLHTSGFPQAPLGPDAWRDRAGRLEQFSRWRLNWDPGSRYEYHPTSAHWVLVELIERLGGVDYRDFIRDRVSQPLGLPGLRLGIPRDEQDGIAIATSVGEPPTPDELEAVLGIRDLELGEVTDENLLFVANDPDARAVGVPGAGAVTTAADLALFYQALLHNPGRLWDQALLHDVTANVRNRFPDPLTGVPANRSLGLVLAGDDGQAAMRGFGATNSPSTFGHNGAGGQVAWADPASGISFCYFTNGLDAHLLRQARRGVALSSRAASLVA